jgi:hypothetical protein
LQSSCVAPWSSGFVMACVVAPSCFVLKLAPACLQEGHRATPRACATPYACIVRQGLLFVKPKALPKRPVASDDTAASKSSSSFSSSSLSRASSAAPTAGGSAAWSSAGSGSAAAAGEGWDGGVDVSGLPVVPEFDDPAWLVQDTWRDVPYDW